MHSLGSSPLLAASLLWLVRVPIASGSGRMMTNMKRFYRLYWLSGHNSMAAALQHAPPLCHAICASLICVAVAPQVDELKAAQAKTNLPDIQIGDSVRLGLLVRGRTAAVFLVPARQHCISQPKHHVLQLG